MLVSEAKDVARRWVDENAAQLPGFHGASFGGSINWFLEDGEFPATSDVDIAIVLDGGEPPDRRGKLSYQGLILDVNYVTRNQLPSAEAILGNHQQAGRYRRPAIILDPSGELTRLQTEVAAGFAKWHWVRERCESARDHSLRYLRAIAHPLPAWPAPDDFEPQFHDHTIVWLFGTGVTTHVLLTAGLRNPTVRRRYAEVRELLTEYGHEDLYGTLLGLLGCEVMNGERVELHLATMTEAFDAAKDVIKTPFFWAADITATARPISVDGSRELVERGLHREAVFWIAVTYARCQTVFFIDAPEQYDRYDAGFRELLADLGITSCPDLERRAAESEVALAEVMDIAEAIMAANPEIEN
jgi:hypothetical protein